MEPSFHELNANIEHSTSRSPLVASGTSDRVAKFELHLGSRLLRRRLLRTLLRARCRTEGENERQRSFAL